MRSELDSNASTITYKIRNAEVRKIPCIALCGRREAETGEIAIRRHGFGNIGCSTTEELAKTSMKSAAKETESTTSKRF